ncbi:MAG: response regulator [Proteobacteria bacterium]|nr:response regulator [Pseudomonadota bacterium]
MSTQEQKTILLVEDEALLSTACEKTLQKYGYKVITAPRGEKAIEKVRTTPGIDLILMDVNLGKCMDGTETAKTIQKDHDDIPVVFLSSHKEKDVVEKTEKITSYGYVVKDSGETVLIASIKMAFKLYEAHRRLKEREGALRASEDRYRRITEGLSDYLYTVLIEDGRVVQTTHNPACEVVTGYTAEEFASNPYLWIDMVPEQEHDIINEHVKNILSGKNISAIEHHIVRKDGSIVWVSDTPILKIDSQGILISYDGVIKDITEHKQAEEKLLQAEKRYRSIFENVVEGIFQTTPEGRFLIVNPSLARIYGHDSPEEMIETVTDIGKQLYVNPDERNEFLRILHKKGLVTGFEMQLKRKDGSTFWASINARCVYDENGNILYHEGTSEDITNRKHLESQLFQSQKMEAIGTLAGGVAHDFNNILTAIMGFGGILQMDMQEDDPSRAFVDEILASSERAANLTYSLLAFSRKQQITLKPLGINDCVKNTSKLLKRFLTEDIELKKRLSRETLVIMGDATQIDQILINLAVNARDAMQMGGILSIETNMITLDDEFIRMHGYGEPGKYVLLSVSDTGHGMDEATKARIFDPFFTTKVVGKGTGLGLSTVYGIVKQHNGYITVYSEHGRGTTFRIYLPSVDIEKEQKASPVHNIQKGSETVLIAEDDPGIRKFTREILQRYGYTIIEAIDGEEAVRTFMENRNRIGLIILDVVMPGKNGKEVYDEIVKTDPGMKFLFTSGYTRDIMLDKGIREDAVDFIPKPLLPDELLKKIRDVLDG